MPLTVTTRPCMHCGRSGSIVLADDQVVGYRRWLAGDFVLIQDAVPTLPREQREQLMTGTHPACWDAMFPPEEDK